MDERKKKIQGYDAILGAGKLYIDAYIDGYDESIIKFDAAYRAALKDLEADATNPLKLAKLQEASGALQTVSGARANITKKLFDIANGIIAAIR